MGLGAHGQPATSWTELVLIGRFCNKRRRFMYIHSFVHTCTVVYMQVQTFAYVGVLNHAPCAHPSSGSVYCTSEALTTNQGSPIGSLIRTLAGGKGEGSRGPS